MPGLIISITANAIQPLRSVGCMNKYSKPPKSNIQKIVIATRAPLSIVFLSPTLNLLQGASAPEQFNDLLRSRRLAITSLMRTIVTTTHQVELLSGCLFSTLRAVNDDFSLERVRYIFFHLISFLPPLVPFQGASAPKQTGRNRLTGAEPPGYSVSLPT